MKSPTSVPALVVLLLAFVQCQAFSTTGILAAKKSSRPRLQLRARSDDDVDAITNVDRRGLLNTVAGSALTIGSLALNPSSASAAPPAGGFVGTYSDPINHPGGTRNIKLVEGSKVGDYQLAQVFGGGGRGEPKEYVLPAVVVGDRAIIIDFSPKGGPKDFSGVLQDDGSIKFLRDGNRWPRIES